MEFVTANLQVRLLEELKSASQADIAVAFFCPEGTTLDALQRVPRLRILVSNNFQINNPYSLELLHKNGKWVRALPPEDYGGNLHSKVYFITRKNGSLWAMVGSANLTRAGLISNQEACIILDSKDRADAVQLNAIRKWIRATCRQNIPEIDFAIAKAVYEAQNYKNLFGPPQASTGYWALKPGKNGEFWQNWLAESVISIGFGALAGTEKISREEARSAYCAAFPDYSKAEVIQRISQILKFTQCIQSGHKVFICGQFNSTGSVDRDVYIYGAARTIEINGDSYFFDEKSTWRHQCKRHALIQPIQQQIPRSIISKAMQKGAFRRTIMQLDKQSYNALETILRDELGVVLQV